MSLAKGITSGYFPFGACMLSEEVAEVFENGATDAGAIWHGYTYSAHPVGAAAALTCIRESQRMAINENAANRGDQLFAGLNALKERHEVIGDVRGGHGLMCALELVTDRGTKAPADAGMLAQVSNATYEAGAMVRVGSNNILMSPPLVITETEIATLLAALDAGLSSL